jgi:LuxR family maltose regulon positive regulatory protein
MQIAYNDQILSTKLYIPRAHPNRVARPRLIGHLNEAMQRPVTLVCAPAGYGKTTLLSEWIPQYEHCVTWLSLDEGDNDPVRFWRHFLAALQTLDPDLCKNAQLALEGSQAPPIESVLTLTINELARLDYRFSHVFDDYHLVDNLAIDNGLAFLIEHLPPNVNLVIASRSDPALPLARWRTRRQMTEIRSADLRFTREESTSFFNQVMELDLSEGDVAVLDGRAEGWISGLQLAALSIKEHADRSRFITAFAGSHRFIIDYLVDEVLSQQPDHVREFLLATSILNQMCGPLCDAITGRDNGQAILEGLELSNLFVVPLDDHRGWYRYHNLFGEVLQSHLHATNDGKTPELHVRAAGWFETNGLTVEAIQHALVAKDWERAVRLIMDVADTVAFTQGQFRTVLTWLQTLPDKIMQSQPRLSLIRAWILLNVGSSDAVEENLLAAERALSTQEPAQRPPLQGEITALRAMLASYRREISRTIELCRQAREQLPERNVFLRAAVANALGLAYRFSGQAVEASQAFSEAITLSQAAGNYYIMMDSVANLARMQMLRGQLSASEQTSRQALQFADEQASASGHPLFDAGFPHIRLGEVLRERNDLDSAEELILKGIELGKLGGNLDIVMTGYGFLVGVKKAQGDLAGAWAAMKIFEEIVVSFDNKIMRFGASARSVRLSLSQGDLASADDWARQYESFTDKDPAFLGEFSRITLARIRLAQSRFAEALELLEQFRKDAEAAERMGSAIEILALEGLAFAAQGDQSRALSSLERALTIAEPEGYVRIFVDEGEPIRLLLRDYQSTIKKHIGNGIDSQSLRLLAYIEKLLAAFSQPASAEKSKTATMLEPLSERELDILRLIATGRTNQEIADILVIAVSTVKSHINNLYGKLGTQRRTQAIAIARDIGLLAE